jgi:hypothetical protein
MFPHRNIHKYTWTSPDEKTHNQIDHILVDRRRHSTVLDVRSFRSADCDSDNYLVVAKARERLAVNKQISRRFNIDRFNLKKLNDVEGKEQFRVEVSNRFVALEDLDTEMEINGAWETIRENIKISAKESLTWSLTLREERRLRVFENRVLRRIFRLKRDEVTGEWRKLH